MEVERKKIIISYVLFSISPNALQLNEVAVRRSFSQGDKVKIETEDFGTIYGEFHRYGASRFGAIIFVNGVMRFVDEQSLNYS
jgi:hypothetical protein